MEQKANSFLETERIGVLMRRYSVPCIISLLVAALYNIVDQLFIANAAYLGSHGNAANTAVFPLTVVALAVAVMIGDGACAFVSIALGRGSRRDAAATVGSAVTLSVLSGVAVMALYLLFSDALLKLFGATVSEETYRLAKEYFFWITLGIPFYMFGQAMNPIIRSDGSPRFAMVSTLVGALVNLVLDPVAIFLLHWGMMGAAVATVLGQVVTAALAVYYLRHMKSVTLTRRCFRPDGQLMRRFLPLGFTSLLSQLSLVAAMAAINNMLRRYGGLDPVFSQAEYAQIPMAVVGIVMKFFQIVISVAVGLAAGCIPVAGYNIGAGRRDRARALFLHLLACEAILGLAALLVVELMPRQLIAAFGAANESRYYTDFAVKSFRVYLCMMVLATVNKGTFIYLQAIGKALPSALISLMRELVFGVGFALLLPRFFGLDGVLYSMPVSDLLTGCISAVVVLRVLRELGGNDARESEVRPCLRPET
ncbi:MAG: MATE family efflux transporter [Ruminococcaceae bacterium]|nr:MATE family efflux transporter [Oscillospiraceae bacterium]